MKFFDSMERSMTLGMRTMHGETVSRREFFDMVSRREQHKI